MKLTYSEQIRVIRERQKARDEVAEITMTVRAICSAAATAILLMALTFWASH